MSPAACDFRPVASKYLQLKQHDPLGGVNCTAYAAAAAAAYDSCGKCLLTGRQIREKSGEPIPDVHSPGLTLSQVISAIGMLTHHGDVMLTKYTQDQALDWNEYEERRLAGHGFITQIDYTPIEQSAFCAQKGFNDGHALFETREATYDPLADGHAGLFKFSGKVYDRALVKEAAGQLVTDPGPPVRRAGFGKVWCAMTRDRRSGAVDAPVDSGGNQMIVAEGLTVVSSHVMALKEDTPLLRTSQPGSDIVTRMSVAAKVDYVGKAGNGMAAVVVRTKAFDDHVLRPVILYVPADSGPVTPK